MFGGRLTPEWLLDAYRHGIFPWPIFDGTDVLVWWTPDPRAIIEFDRLHISRRLVQTCRGDRFAVTLNKDFHGVLIGCATVIGPLLSFLVGRRVAQGSRRLTNALLDLGSDIPVKNRRGGDALLALVKSEIAKWTPVIKAAGPTN